MSNECVAEDLENYIVALRAIHLPTMHGVRYENDDGIYLTGERNKKGRSLEWMFPLETGKPIHRDLWPATTHANPVGYLPAIITVGDPYFLTIVPRRVRHGRRHDLVGIEISSEDVSYLDLHNPPRNMQQRQLLKFIQERTEDPTDNILRSEYPDLTRALIEKMVELWAQDWFP